MTSAQPAKYAQGTDKCISGFISPLLVIKLASESMTNCDIISWFIEVITFLAGADCELLSKLKVWWCFRSTAVGDNRCVSEEPVI